MTPRVLWSGDHLKLNIGEQTLLDDTFFSVNDLEHVALVGRNGCGKTTFMKIVAGFETPSSGEISIAKKLRIAYMDQAFEQPPERTVLEAVCSGMTFFTEALKRYQTLSATSPEHDSIEQLLTIHDMWDPERKALELLEKLHLTDPEKRCGTLSGGEARRVTLAKTLAAQPELLLLDEPTNHLDVESIAWIEEFLAGFKGAAVFVTHDRFFLDRIATRIVELDHGKFYSCEGSYADFLAYKEEREYNEDVLEQKRKSFLRREIEWVRRSPKARLRRNLGRLKHYDEIAAQSAPERIGDIDLVIPRADHLGNRVLELENVSLALGGKTLFQNFSFEFQQGMKVGIVGPNGAGKTSLLRLLAGESVPDSGKIFTAETVVFNYVDQNRIALNPENTVLEEIAEGHEYLNLGAERISVRSYLKRFLFEDDRIRTRVERLSGGEKARLTLAKILRGGGNFLILDEPTNDLDLPTLRVLEESLMTYTGCLAVVSHDRYFLNRVCNHILALEDHGKIVSSVGDYDYYLSKKATQKPMPAAPVPEKNIPPPVRKNVQKELSFKEKKELAATEELIGILETRIGEIEALYSEPDFFKKHGTEAISLQGELNAKKKSLEDAYAKWEFLEEKRLSFEK